MIRRIALLLIAIVVAVVALPPLWFAVFPEEPPALPPAGRRVEVAPGLAVNVVERGTGPPVVLVHGLPGTAYDWRLQTDALAERGLHVFAYDRVGFGRSDSRPDDDYSVERNATELLGLLAALPVEGATVVGWSYGGSTAILAARRERDRDPPRIRRLVLVGSAGPGAESEDDSEDPPLADLLFSRPMLRWLSAVPPAGRAVRASMSEQAFSGQAQPVWWQPTLAANLGQWHTLMTWREEGRSFGDAPPDTAGLELPVLVIQGDDDRFVPMEVARTLDGNAARSRLVVVEGGSHMLPITHPDLLADEIAAFATE